MERKTRQNRSGAWETELTVEVDMEHSSINGVFESLQRAMKSLVKEGIPREEIKFEVNTSAYYDGETLVTHTLEAVRPATPKEIERAKRTVTLEEHSREERLRKELAQIEARRAART